MSTGDQSPGVAAQEHIAGSRVQQVMAGTAAFIRHNSLRVGDRLPSEGQFAKEYGVSRTVVREAFGALAALGVLDVGNGRRPRVSPVRADTLSISLGHAVHTRQVSLLQVWDVRQCIELKTASLAAVWRTEEAAKAILNCARAMLDLQGAPAEMTGHDIRFHRLIAAASGNLIFENILASMEPLMREAVPAAWATRKTDEERARIVEHHLALARAIADRDARAAEAAMEQHFDQSISRSLRQLNYDIS